MNTRTVTRKKQRSEFPLGLLVLAIVSVVSWALWWLWIQREYGKLTTAAELGDSFGAINALFSALAFAGVIYAIFLQRKELRYQRLELRQTRRELAGQREQMELQNTLVRQQSFENTFFQSVRLHHDIVEGLIYVRSGGGRPLEGREVFGDVAQAIRHHLPAFLGGRAPEQAIDDAWEVVYQEHQNHLSHYFRNLYHTVNFVHNAADVAEKTSYTSLFRAQLSAQEHVALFFHGLSRYGRKQLKPLIERYGLLENVRLQTISAISPNLLRLYEPQAYGDDLGEVNKMLSAAGLAFP